MSGQIVERQEKEIKVLREGFEKISETEHGDYTVTIGTHNDEILINRFARETLAKADQISRDKGGV